MIVYPLEWTPTPAIIVKIKSQMHPNEVHGVCHSSRLGSLWPIRLFLFAFAFPVQLPVSLHLSIFK